MARTNSLSTSSVVGALVRNTEGEEIGILSDVIWDLPRGRLRFGLIGLDHETALLVVPWELIQFRPGERVALLNAFVSDLRGAPRLERSDSPCVTDPQSDHDVYAYYGCRPYWEAPAEETTTVPQARRHLSRPRLALGLVSLALVVGLGYLVLRQGWSVAASDVYGIAEAVKDTTAAVRDSSADAATTAKAKTALALSKRVSAFDVNVDTVNATVTLTGRVPSPESKDVAGLIVADTSGVREVRNLLTIDPSVRPERERLARRVNDLETQMALSQALQDSPELDGAKVRVRVADGAVTLDGTVASEPQKLHAEAVARAFPGVQLVTNRLR